MSFNTNVLNSRFNILDGFKALKMQHCTVWSMHGFLCFNGAQGSGKSCSAHKLIKQLTDEYPNLTVMSNVPLSYVDYIPYSYDFLMDLDKKDIKGIILFLDEIVNMFSNQEKIDPKWFNILNLLRKRELLIIGTAPNFNAINKNFRLQFDTICICSNYFRVFQVNRYYKADRDLIALADETKDQLQGMKLIRTNFFFHSPDDYNRYDTSQLVRKEDFIHD